MVYIGSTAGVFYSQGQRVSMKFDPQKYGNLQQICSKSDANSLSSTITMDYSPLILTGLNRREQRGFRWLEGPQTSCSC